MMNRSFTRFLSVILLFEMIVFVDRSILEAQAAESTPVTFETPAVTITIDSAAKKMSLSSPSWKSLHLQPLHTSITVNGNTLYPSSTEAALEGTGTAKTLRVTHSFSPYNLKLIERFSLRDNDIMHLHPVLVNDTGGLIVLNNVTLFELRRADAKDTVFGTNQLKARVFPNNGLNFDYSASVRTLKTYIEPYESENVWEIYNPADKKVFLAGFTTFARWNGTMMTHFDSKDSTLSWSLGFDGGDTVLDPGETVLEDVVFIAGDDPWRQAERYAEFVQKIHNITVLDTPPVSLCSWYLYRLDVTEDLMLANARIAAERLKPLGMKYFVVDLGWEEGYLPNSFQENKQFPHGLRWLADRLNEQGLELGVWKAPLNISEFHALSREHPDWLVKDADGNPIVYWIWYWKPHGKVYSLDVTNDEARNWLKTNVESLARRGVTYLKTDFMGALRIPKMKNRHNPRVVTGGGLEATRIAVQTINNALDSGNKNAISLNCAAGMAGLGYYELLYSCNDTGNTGTTWDYIRANYTALACNMFKNGRWGIIQPSCLCIGLPGTLEEARMRSTATFMCGGQVDVGDELTTLPEERWDVLLATLPPLGKTAKPVDLFEPLKADIDTSSACVWHLTMKSGWDSWDLIAFFGYEGSNSFSIPLEQLGLDAGKDYWVYEFWSGQFVDTIPYVNATAEGFLKRSEFQRLISGKTRGVLDIQFAGPAVKLLAVREARGHPWVAGTSFHQSCGMELKNVRWDAKRRELTGELHRPVGQHGDIIIAGFGDTEVTAAVAGQRVTAKPGANKSLVLPILTEDAVTRWSVKGM